MNDLVGDVVCRCSMLFVEIDRAQLSHARVQLGVLFDALERLKYGLLAIDRRVVRVDLSQAREHRIVVVHV